MPMPLNIAQVALFLGSGPLFGLGLFNLFHRPQLGVLLGLITPLITLLLVALVVEGIISPIRRQMMMREMKTEHQEKQRHADDSSRQIHRIDDPHDDRSHGGLRIIKNLPRAVPLVEHEHALPYSGVDRGDSDQIAAAGFACRVEPVNDREPPIVVIGVIDRRNDFAGNLANEQVQFPTSDRTRTHLAPGH